MRRERHVNAQTLTLNGSINATQTSITLSDATNLPSEGDFRIAVDDEIMLVTHRTVNTLTVVRAIDGSSGNAHASASPTILIATQCGMERLMADAFGPSWLDQDAPTHPTVNSSSFSWVNQGTSSVIDETWGGMTLLSQNSSPHSLRCLAQSQPSEPFTVTAKIDIGVDKLQGITGSHGGLLLRESSTGKIQTLSLRSDNTLSWFAWTNATSYAATVADIDLEINPGGWWLRFYHDGTDIYGYASADGINWLSIGSIAKTTRFTTDSDQVGFYFANYGSDDQFIHCNAFVAE